MTVQCLPNDAFNGLLKPIGSLITGVKTSVKTGVNTAYKTRYTVGRMF